MGLDIRLSYKKEETIYEANGRNAFAYVEKWVKGKGARFEDEFYGEDIQLTKKDIDTLIAGAISQYLEDFDSKEELIKDAIGDTHTYFYTEFLGKLLAIKGSEDYEDYYLECDW